MPGEAMLLIIGTIRLPAEHLQAARAVMTEMVMASRAEEGCEEYSYSDDVLEPGLVRITELWRDQAALDRHFASAHLDVWRAAWPRFGIGDRNLRIYEVGSPRST
jgi:quinol monooxygenase YgiN